MSIDRFRELLGGWVDHPDREAMARRQGLIALASIAPWMEADGPPADLLNYLAWKDVLGDYPAYPAQEIGDCESFGHGHGHDLLQCLEIAYDDAPLDYRETSTEALYGAGREAGNMLGWGDGCYGSAMVKAMTSVGMVPREAVGDGKYSGNRAKQWGHDGVPAAIKKLASDHKLGSAALCSTYDEMIATLNNLGVVSISSDQGFEGGWGGHGFNRDANGICEAGGTWGHCMVIVGRISSDGTDTAVISQSWGPTMPGGPRPFDLPPFCFRARKPIVERILSQGDSFSLFEPPGFIARPYPKRWTNAGWTS